MSQEDQNSEINLIDNNLENLDQPNSYENDLEIEKSSSDHVPINAPI